MNFIRRRLSSGPKPDWNTSAFEAGTCNIKTYYTLRRADGTTLWTPSGCGGRPAGHYQSALSGREAHVDYR